MLTHRCKFTMHALAHSRAWPCAPANTHKHTCTLCAGSPACTCDAHARPALRHHSLEDSICRNLLHGCTGAQEPGTLLTYASAHGPALACARYAVLFALCCAVRSILCCACCGPQAEPRTKALGRHMKRALGIGKKLEEKQGQLIYKGMPG